ncbi:MAG: LysR family transcriptional regulator [Rhodocyclaceae bacterium]|nr:LysR family transcriptional regulator [Rhodocyclaceae bacterium]
MMRLRQIEIFRAVMLSGSVSAAARMLHVSQPVVSRIVRHAEQSLGFALFERSRGRLVPTPEAEALYCQVRRSWTEIERIDALVGSLRQGGASGLRIAATPTLAASLLPQAVAALQRQYPAMQCDLWAIHTAEIEQRLATQEIDAGIALEPPERVTVAVSQLADTEILLAVPQAWSMTVTPSRRLLADRPYIALAESTPLGDALTGLLERAGWQAEAGLRVQTYRMAGSLVEQGAGHAFIDGFTAVGLDPDKVALFRIRPSLPVHLHLMRASTAAPSLTLPRLDKELRRAALALLAELPARLQPDSALLDGGD